MLTPTDKPKNWIERTRAAFAPEEHFGGTTTPEGRRRAILLLFVCLIANGVGQTLMFAILPPLARELGLSELGVGSIFAVSAFIWVFSSAYWGAKSDVWGRRPVILLGLAAFGISTLAFASVMSFGLMGLIAPMATWILLVTTRSIFGIFGSGSFPASQAYIADRTTAQERTDGMATLNAAFGLGAAVGPGVGAALIVLASLRSPRPLRSGFCCRSARARITARRQSRSPGSIRGSFRSSSLPWGREQLARSRSRPSPSSFATRCISRRRTLSS
jgi:MFS family permease